MDANTAFLIYAFLLCVAVIAAGMVSLLLGFRPLVRGVVLSSALIIAAMVSPAWAVSIGGVAFEDGNRNGIFDIEEAPLAGLRILLMGAAGTALQLAQTGEDGSYLFSDLPEGSYVLSVPRDARLRASLPQLTADPAPIPDFPFGRPRYASMPKLVANLHRAATEQSSFRHVALGDSIGFGFNFCGSLFGDDGYIEPTTERLRQATAADVITDKQAIPGHETADLLIPGLGPGFPFFFNDVFYAIDVRAPLVSISIGGNDFLGAEDGGDAELAKALVIARRNVQEIVSNLVSELPFADIEFNTVYDNLEGNDPLHNVWAPIWNQVLRETTWGQARRVTLAEIYPEYAHEEGGNVLGQPGLICQFFGLDEIHPTNSGYDVHEEKLWQSFGGVTLAGGDQLNFNLGFLRVRRRVTANEFTDITGDTANPELALQPDGVGALVSSGNAEFRLSNFLPVEPPAHLDLAQGVLLIRYRTTAPPLDDYYRFEASIDGSFSPPGSTPTTWNTIIPVVGSSGNDDAVILAFPDQPDFRVVAAPLYLGAPTSGAGTLSWEDLQTLTVRVVTTAVGEPDDYAVEWDAAAVEVFTSPVGDDIDKLVAPLADAGETLPPDPIAAAKDPDPGVRRSAARELAHLGEDAPLEVLTEMVADTDMSVRRTAVRSLSQLTGTDEVLLQSMEDGQPTGVQVEAAAALLERGNTSGVGILIKALARIPPSARAREVLVEHGAAYPEVFGALLAALEDPDDNVRAWAAWLLGQYGKASELVLRALRPLLADASPAVQIAAMEALSRLRDRESIAHIAAMRAEPGFLVNVVRALGRFDEPAAHPTLFEIAASVNAPLTARRMAARALAKSSSPEVVPMLKALQDSSDVRIRRLAAAGLKRLAR
jgi:HEAT repeat protein